MTASCRSPLAMLQLVLKSPVMEDMTTLAKNEIHLTTKRAIFVASNMQKKLSMSPFCRNSFF